MSLNYFASSPTVVLPPQQPPNYFSEMNATTTRHPSPPRKCPTPPSMNYLANAGKSILGRKRSIHDVEPEELPADCPTAVLPKKLEPIYGPGMTLIYPDDPGFAIAAESQTGTWAEEKQEKLEKEAPPARPIAISRKSQRRHDSLSSSPIATSPSASVIDENGHTVDQLIAELGIGWKNLMDDTSSSTRAYTRVIENHFPLTDATIMLESEALSAYLVRANEAGNTKFWLFHESLSWCQLLSNTLQGAVNNLKAGPVPAVEGPRITAQRNTPPATPPADDINMSAPTASNEDDVMQM